MALLKDMYKGIAFSPQTALTQPINASVTTISVADETVFPAPPNYATIGSDETGETIFYTSKGVGILSGITRGVEGTAKSWAKDDLIARNFTFRDHESLIDNINELDGDLTTGLAGKIGISDLTADNVTAEDLDLTSTYSEYGILQINDVQDGLFKVFRSVAFHDAKNIAHNATHQPTPDRIITRDEGGGAQVEEGTFPKSIVNLTQLQGELSALDGAVVAKLALKADKTQVATDLSLKADKTTVATGLDLKADKTQVTAELALKADKTQLVTDLALKADKAQVVADLALKATKMDIPQFSIPARKAIGNGEPYSSIGYSTTPASGTVVVRKTGGIVTAGTPILDDDAVNLGFANDYLASKSIKYAKLITTTWAGSAPATQTILVTGATATNIVELSLSSTATQAETEAFSALQLQDGGQAVGSITLKAWGDVNTIAIPINVIVRGDI